MIEFGQHTLSMAQGRRLTPFICARQGAQKYAPWPRRRVKQYGAGLELSARVRSFAYLGNQSGHPATKTRVGSKWGPLFIMRCHAERTSTTLTQCSGLQSIRKMCHLASIVSQDGDIRF